jgi:hypothetical protein
MYLYSCKCDLIQHFPKSDVQADAGPGNISIFLNTAYNYKNWKNYFYTISNFFVMVK